MAKCNTEENPEEMAVDNIDHHAKPFEDDPKPSNNSFDWNLPWNLP